MGEAREASETLCKECGLCCDGTFFGSVVIASDETTPPVTKMYLV